MPFAFLPNSSLHAQADLGSWDSGVIQQAVATISPCVVQIETIGGSDQVGGMPVPDQPATGTIVNSDGFVITAAFNLAHEPATIFVRLPDGTRLPAELVSRNHSRQVALLKVEASDNPQFPSPEFVSRPELQVGQTTIAVGRTMSLEQCNISTGIVSATHRIWGRAIQTDAKISPNNFGGPLVDLQGRVLGILVPLSPRGDEVAAGLDWYDSGIGFAVPLDELNLRIMSSGEDLYPGRSGLSFREDRGYASQPIVAECRGNSPAAIAGIKPGDQITQINNISVERVAQVRHVIGPLYAGETVAMTCLRDGDEFDAVVELVAEIEPFRHVMLGVVPDTRDTSVIARIMPDGPAGIAGLQKGDRVIKLSGQAVADAEQITNQLMSQAVGDEVEVVAERNGQPVAVTVKLEPLEAGPVELPPLAGDAGQPQTVVIRVPEHSNECHACAPDVEQPLGLLLWMGEPGPFDVDAEINRWQAWCDQHGLVLLLPRSADDRAWSPGESEFLAKAVRQVRKNYNIDPRRIAVGGSGSGGVMASLTCKDHRDLFGGLILLDSGISQRLSGFESEAVNRLIVLMLEPEAASKPVTQAMQLAREQLTKQGFPLHFQKLDVDSVPPEIITSWVAAISRF